VDENLRRDRATDFAKKYGRWMVAAVVLFLFAAGGWIYWQQRQVKAAERQVEQLAETYRGLGAGNLAASAKQVDELAKSRSDAVRASAKFTRAAIALEQNDTKLATATYGQIAGDGGLPKPYRDMALLRQTALEFDSLKPEEVIGRLAPLAKAGNPWFGTAGEITAAALIKQGKSQEAGRLHAAIAKDNSVPQDLRARSVQIAASLGVDAGTIAPTPAQ
jgi:hypothetical protein